MITPPQIFTPVSTKLFNQQDVTCVFCEISTGENTTWAGERGGGCWEGAEPV